MLTLDSSSALSMCAVVGGRELAFLSRALLLMLVSGSWALELTCSSYVLFTLMAFDLAKVLRSSFCEALRCRPSHLLAQLSLHALLFSSLDSAAGAAAAGLLLAWRTATAYDEDAEGDNWGKFNHRMPGRVQYRISTVDSEREDVSEDAPDLCDPVLREVHRANWSVPTMSYHQHYQRGPHGRTLSSEERSATPINKTSTPVHKSASSSSSSQRDSRQEVDSWEIIEGLKIGQSNVQRPDKHEGFMLKKRKWPLKGWHKRFFVLDNGILKYSKSPIDIQKGKLHGSIDVGLSVMSIKKRARRIDLDTEEHIYHLKVKSQEIFDAWVSKLRHHRLYRQNEIVRSPRDATMRTFPPPATMDRPSQAACHGSQWLPATAATVACLPPTVTARARWLLGCRNQRRWTSVQRINCVELSKKEKRMNRRWRTKSVGKDAKFQLQVPLSASMSPVRLHSSNPNLCAELVDFQPPVSRLTDSVECASDYIKLQEEFCTIAQKVHSLLKSAFNTVAIEKEKIKQILSDQEQSDQSAQINSLRKSLSQALSQNAELRTRLSRIHSESVLTEQVVSVNIISTPDEAGEQMGIPLTQQASNESRLSMSESVSEFFDAQEVLLSASSSENEV
ncbi:hypothetical protein INR49_005425 [Caranx melampygus]|nr:hypothetical protein INR49_005425 [Caranx melampygus]